VALYRDDEGRFFLLDWPALEPQSTRPHTYVSICRNGGGRWDGRCCTRARCVITEHPSQIAAKAPCGPWSNEVAYLPGSAAGGVPEERSAALICAGAPV
jgi:hypothetical protein